MAGIRSHRDRHSHRPPQSDGPPRRLTRVRDGRIVAGVAGGLARRIGWDPNIVRLALVVMTIAGGSGILAYVAAWLFLPWEDGEGTIAQVAVKDQKALLTGAVAGLSVLAVLLVLDGLGLFASGLVWPLAIVTAGVVVIWRTAVDPDDRAAADRLMARFPELPEWKGGRVSIARVVAGAVLVVGGMALLLAANGALTAIRQGVLAAVGIVGGVALIFGPWWYRLARDLADERRERIRSQERAEVAAHLHDSVLQTLALIQRRADDPRAVTSLARIQERDLRAWLFASDAGTASVPGARADPSPDTFALAVRRAAHAVEDSHDVTVEVVAVGDAPLDDGLLAMVAAAREAMVNAAKWSGQPALSVYAEVEAAQVSLFVRDRGSGFDPSAVGADRRGLAESVRGRMERHGGAAVIRSVLSEGTEIELRLPRTAAA